MKIMSVNNCPCCSTSMLLHLSSRRSYWLCPHCRLEMPNSVSRADRNESKTIRFTSSPIKAVISPLKSEPSILTV